MSSEDILARVNKVVSEKLGIPVANINPDSNFVNDLGINSLDAVELTSAMREEFAIEIPAEESEKLITVQVAVDYIKAHPKIAKGKHHQHAGKDSKKHSK